MKPSKYITANTVNYTLNIDPGMNGGPDLGMHTATIRWRSNIIDGYSAPSKISLCIGGDNFTYEVKE